jgi:hypothetical protein
MMWARRDLACTIMNLLPAPPLFDNTSNKRPNRKFHGERCLIGIRFAFNGSMLPYLSLPEPGFFVFGMRAR